MLNGEPSGVTRKRRYRVKETYLQNLKDPLVAGSRKALHYRGQGCGKDWANKKIKIAKSNRPRGKASLRFWDLEAGLKRLQTLMAKGGVKLENTILDNAKEKGLTTTT